MRLAAPRYECLWYDSENPYGRRRWASAVKDLHTNTIVFSTKETYPKGYENTIRCWKRFNDDWEEFELCRRNNTH